MTIYATSPRSYKKPSPVAAHGLSQRSDRKRSTRVDPRDTPEEMSIAPRALIKQAIVKDRGWDRRLSAQEETWDASRTKVFNVQILNILHFRHVTGLDAPKPPIDAHTYTLLGLPFYTVNEEPTDVAGDFAGVKSVGEIDGVMDDILEPMKTVRVGKIPWYKKLSSPPPKPTRPSATPPQPDPKKLRKWRCSNCNHKNSSSFQYCPSCGAAKPVSTPGTSSTVDTPSDTAPRTPTDASADKPAFRGNKSKVSKNAGLHSNFFNSNGPMSPFRSLSELERQLGAQEIVTF